MSGETEEQISGWTVDTLHSHILRLLNEKDKRDEQRFEALQRAIEKAEAAVKDRFDSVNEFRAQLGDQSRTFLPRMEYDRAHTDLIERVDQIRATHADHLQLLDKQMSEAHSRRGGMVEAWGYILGAIGAISAVVAIIISTR